MKKEYGFSIVDLMVAIAIIGIISAASVPNLKRWVRNYNVQSAAMDLYAHMQMAKLGAVNADFRGAKLAHSSPHALQHFSRSMGSLSSVL